jgi:predicted permease
MLREFRLRIRALWKRRQLERDLEDELAYHMELRQSGARAPFGNATLVREEMRDMWRFTKLEDLGRDLSHGLRILRRTPGQTAAIILLLAIGIGANTAIFSLLDSVLLRDLPVSDPKGLIILNRLTVEGTSASGGAAFSTPLFDRFRAQVTTMNLAAVGDLSNPQFKLAADAVEEVADTDGFLVSGSFFQLLGVQAAIGRVFTPADDVPGDPHAVIVLSYDFWRRVFGSDPGVIGRKVYLYGSPFTILGVMPKTFRGIGRDFWVPLEMQPVAGGGEDVRNNPGRTWLRVIGRVKNGISRDQAQREAAIVLNELIPAPAGQAPWKISVAPGNRSFTLNMLEERYGSPLRILMGAVGMLLLVACANVASILLARSEARKQEIAVRQAIGCGRGRLLRQFLVENLLLTGIGGTLGVLLATLGARALLLLAEPETIDRVYTGMNTRILLFTLVVSVGAAMVFGLAPALRASYSSLNPVLKNASRGAKGSRSRLWLNRTFVFAQAALSMMLVIGAVLFAANLYRLYRVDPGYAPAQIVSATVNGRNLGYKDPQEYARLAERLVERISDVPGVQSATVSATGFFAGMRRTSDVVIPSAGGPRSIDNVRVDQSSRSLLQTLDIPIVAGRRFARRNQTDVGREVIVNRQFVQAHLGGENPVGKQIVIDNKPATIVGVAADAKFNDLRERPTAVVFLPIDDFPARFNVVNVRTSGSAAAVIPFITRAILEVEPRLRPARVETLDTSRSRVIARDILLARLSALFGGFALLVACFGIYGIMSYVVSSRTGEIGIRMALGARPASVWGSVIGDALKTVVPGLALGVLGALATERYVEALVFNMTGHDPWIYSAVAASLILTSILAAWIPARRAARIDPISALRCE